VDWRKVTQWTLIGVTFALVCYDAAVMSREGVNTTISRVVLQWSQNNPLIPFAFGIVCGHLFWPQPVEKRK
jgi:hypothetical protein